MGRTAVATVIGTLVLLLTPGGGRADVWPVLEPGGAATVTEVIDGDTVVLDDGRQVRLVGIQAPKLPLGRKGFEEWPLAQQAKAALAGMTLGKSVELRYGGRRLDRHQRALAQLFTEDGFWVQGAMLREGMARVYTFADNRALAGEMYAAEGAARAARKGIWSNGSYAIRTPEQVDRNIGTFQIVEGRIVRAEQVRGRVYLNFADDWRTDFTVVIASGDLPMFRAAGWDPLETAGRVVRMRGWLRKWNGPMIEATHPEQIEFPGGN